MTKTQALTEAVRRWGKSAAVQDRGKGAAIDPDVREQMRAELIALNKLPKPEEPNLEAWPDEACAKWCQCAILVV